MLVVMKQNEMAATADGSRVERYHRGREYEVSVALAQAWIECGSAEAPSEVVAPQNTKPAAPVRRKKRDA